MLGALIARKSILIYDYFILFDCHLFLPERSSAIYVYYFGPLYNYR